MYSFADVQKEITAKIEGMEREGHSMLHPDWITQAVMGDHPDVHGDDAPFHTCCSRAQVRNEVRQQLNKFKPDAGKTSAQLVLDGFERLQHYYLVNRDKAQIAVRIDELTDEEIEAKAIEQETMGRACMQHADELRRYRELRAQKVVAPPLHATMNSEIELRA